MRKIQVEELKPGMRFDKPVYIDSNNIFIGANITIKEDDIKKLMRWGVSDLETAGTMIATKEEIKHYSSWSETHSVSDSKKIITDYNNLLKKEKILLMFIKKPAGLSVIFTVQLKTMKNLQLMILNLL